jgi:EpsI family protein
MMNPRAVVIAALLLSAAGARHVALNARPMWRSHTTLTRFPAELGPWRSDGDVPFSATIESVLGVDQYVNRTYRMNDAAFASLYVGYYENQRQGTTIHSPLNCLPGAGWQPISSDRLAIDGRSDLIVNRVIVQKGEARQLVYYWYQTRGRIIASEYWSKFYLVTDSIMSARSDAALVRVVVALRPGEDGGSDADVRGFVARAASSVATVLFQQKEV